MNAKKYVWSLMTILIVFTMALSACTSATPAPTAEEPVATEAPAEPVATEPPSEEMPTGDFTVMPGGYLEKALAGEYNGTTVTVDGPFTAPDDARFAESMAAFEDATGITVKYIGDKTFESRIAISVDAGNPPDIADFPQPGAVANYARQGYLIDPASWISEDWLKQQYNQSWLDMGTDGRTGRCTDHGWCLAPLQWQEPGMVSEGSSLMQRGMKFPTTWDELMALTEQIADDGDTPWCIGIEFGCGHRLAGDGLDRRRDAAHDLAGELRQVGSGRAAVRLTGSEAMRSRPRERRSGSTTTMCTAARHQSPTTFFGDSPEPMFEEPPKCWLHRQGNFITTFFPEGLVAGVDYDFFYLPPIDDAVWQAGAGALATSMTMFNDRPEVRAVIEYFSTPQSAVGLGWRTVAALAAQMMPAWTGTVYPEHPHVATMTPARPPSASMHRT